MGSPMTADRQIRFHEFPIAGIDAMHASTVRAFPRHTHDHYGIGVIDAGGHASWSGRGQVEAGPGDLISVNPGEVHDGRAIERQPRTWRILYVEPALMMRLRSDVLEERHASTAFEFAAPVFADEPTRRRFDAAFEFTLAGAAIGTAARTAHHFQMQCETATLGLIASLGRHSVAGSNGGARRPAVCIRRARQKIDDDPAATTTLAELAREAGISRYQLIRGFARDLGLTPHAYIVQRRIALACRLLKAGGDLAEVAAVAGFCDQSHLTRCFVRQFGVTPRRYARRTE
jgi:AraC-like DNA-binding protein